MRRLRWERDRAVPKRPYRDSVIFYGVLAVLVVAVSAATGGDLVRAVIAAAAVFVGATGYSWWRWRERLRSVNEGQKR